MDVRLNPLHPLRLIDWRFQKAIDLLLKQGHPRCGEAPDLWKEFWRFLRELLACRDAASRRRLMRKWPKFWFAMELYCERTSGLHALIEARLLAGESPNAIGGRLGFSAAVIETFARLFFDVEDRLASVDLIRTVIFQRPDQSHGGEADRELSLRAIGYFGGPVLLDRVLSTPHQAHSETDSRPLEDIAGQLESLFQARVITGTGNLERLDEDALKRWTGLLSELQSVRQVAGDASPGEEAYLKNIQALMDAIPWQLATKQEVPEEFKKFEHSAMELRAHEQLAIARGGEGPDPKTMNLRLLPAGSEVPKPQNQ